MTRNSDQLGKRRGSGLNQDHKISGLRDYLPSVIRMKGWQNTALRDFGTSFEWRLGACRGAATGEGLLDW